uniref:Uncharacterized protein LOC104212410 n=1 Tax=Nicotiana sylvestris TaxID=4096 RepID=A0A1U7VDP4_NICSY|nr:PREDICTED: uncharacterized protein LOC104212410 [Nicotiana sylvestris]
MVRNGAESSLVAEVKEKQLIDPALAQLKAAVLNNKTSTFSLGGEDGILRCQGRLCVPDVDNLWGRQVKAEHQRPGGLTQLMEIPMWKWEMINMNFMVGLPRTQRKFDSIWEIVDRLTKSAHFLPVKSTDTAEQYAQLYIKEIVNLSTAFHPQTDGQAKRTIHTLEDMLRRRCRSPIGWFEVGEAELVGLDLMHQAMEKVKIIQGRMKATQSRQKSYANIRRRKLEFQVAYRLELPPEMSFVHLVFHVSMLKKVVGDSSAIVPIEAIEVNEELSYEEISVAILDKQVRKLRNKEVASVKVLSQSQQIE